MPKKLKLQDAYRFPGFRPASTLNGVFGDQKARVVILSRRSKKMVCGGCGAVNHAIYDRKMARARDLPCGDMRVYVEFEIRRVECAKCGKVKQEKLDWLSDNPAYTKRFAFFFGAQMPGDDSKRGFQRDTPGLEDDKRTG